MLLDFLREIEKQRELDELSQLDSTVAEESKSAAATPVP